MWLIELSHCYFNSCINKTNLLFKVKFRQPSNHCIKVFKSVKLAYANKARVVLPSRNMGLSIFGALLMVLATKLKLLFILFCLLHLAGQMFC